MSNSNKKVHKKINKNTNSKEKDEVKKKSWLDQQPLDMSTVVKEDFNEYNWTFDDDLPKTNKKDVIVKTNKKNEESKTKTKKESKNKDNKDNDNNVTKKINNGNENDEINNKIDDEPKKKKLKTESIKAEVNDSNKTNANNQNDRDMTPITSMKLSKSTEDALRARGIEYLFPIQSLTYWPIREGRDLIGRARTGQGKTLAFCLPILEQLIEKNSIRGSKSSSSSSSSRKDINPKVLIMSPTRELAKQIVTEFQSVAGNILRIEAIYGGTSLNENYNVLKKGVDVIVGTPGRIKDILEKKWLNLQDCAHVVLDEADQMLDMGFQEEITTIFEAFKNEDSTKGKLQVLLFSATMPQWVHSIVNRYMSKDHKIVDLVGDQKMKAVTTVRHIAIPSHWQMLGSTVNDIIAMFAGREGRVLVFCQTKLDCDTVIMDKAIKHECHVLHGDIPQAKREATLNAYKNGNFRVLVATDVAARGLDLSVELVIQAKPPTRNMSGKADVETYVHRSGRTGRAGKSGICVTLWQPKTRYALEEIEKEIGNKFEWRGSLQPLEILAGCGQAVAEELITIDQSIFPYFQDAAKSVISQMGAEKALCAALARISGFTEKPKQKSLLNAQEGMVTMQFNSGKTIPSNGYVYGALMKTFPYDVAQSPKGMRLSKDLTSAVFDIPEEHLEEFKKIIDEMVGFKWLSICEELPPLKMLDESKSPSSRGGFSPSGRGGRGRDGRGFGGREGGGRGFGGREGSGRGFGGREGGRGRGEKRKRDNY